MVLLIITKRTDNNDDNTHHTLPFIHLSCEVNEGHPPVTEPCRETGLGFDRNFMITDETGKFITARRYPQMVLFTPVLLSNGIYLRSPEGSGATILFEDFRPDHLPCEVWGNHFTSLLAPEKINQWLCQFFDIPVQLRWLSPQSTRRVKIPGHCGVVCRRLSLSGGQ